jgi:excisionase family DNA binding protein
VTREELLTALAAAEVERARLFAQLITLPSTPEDRLLTISEAADVLNVTTDWLYRHVDEFSITIRPGPGQVRFSRVGLQEYLRRQRR